MSKPHKSEVKRVKTLLGLFGYAEEEKKLKKLAEKNPKGFRSLLQNAEDYGPINFQTRTTKIFLFYGNDLRVLADLEELRILSLPGKELKKAVNHLSLVHDLVGSREQCLYQLVTHEPVSRLEFMSNQEAVKFCHCVLLDDSEQMAYAPADQSGMNAILEKFGWRCAFSFVSYQRDPVVLKERILSMEKRICKFLGLVQSTPPIRKEVTLKRKVPVEKKEVEKKQKVLTCVEEEEEEEEKRECEFTTFAEGLEWFSKIDLNSFVVS